MSDRAMAVKLINLAHGIWDTTYVGPALFMTYEPMRTYAHPYSCLDMCWMYTLDGVQYGKCVEVDLHKSDEELKIEVKIIVHRLIEEAHQTLKNLSSGG